MKKNLIRVIELLIILNIVVCAQSPIEEIKEYVSKGKITFNDNREILVDDIKLETGKISYYDANLFREKTIDLSDVKSVDAFYGNSSTTGTYVGGIIGIVGGIAMSVSSATTKVETNGYYKTETTEYQTWPIYIGSFVGALIGGVIGATAEDWENIYSKKNSLISENMNFIIHPNKQMDGGNLSFVFNF